MAVPVLMLVIADIPFKYISNKNREENHLKNMQLITMVIIFVEVLLLFIMII